MTYASVALFIRDGKKTFKSPRKEQFTQQAQARKAAARYWRGRTIDPDRLDSVFLVRVERTYVSVAQRSRTASIGRPWIEHALTFEQAASMPHIAACLAELGIKKTDDVGMPDVLEINGFTYRREA